MDIFYLGHAAFRLKGKTQTVVSDPFDPEMVGGKFAKQTATASSTLKASDLAIGDYVLAMGTRDANNVLSARRIVVTTQPTYTDPTIYLGKITQASDKSLTVEKGTESVSVAVSKQIKITNETGEKTLSAKSLPVGSRVIVIEGSHVFLLND